MKEIFGKKGTIDNQFRRWDKQVDNAARNVDSSLAKMLGMDGAKPSHLLNQDSPKHKEAVEFFCGEKSTPDANSTADASPTVVVDQSKASETTPQPPSEVQTADSSATNTESSVQPVVSAAVETVTKEEASQDQVKETETSSSRIVSTPQDDKVETSPIGATISEVSGKTIDEEEDKNLTHIVKNKILVIADKCFKEYHEHRTISDDYKIMLRTLIKTSQELEELKVDTFRFADSDVSLLDDAMGVVGVYSDLFSNIGHD